MRHHEKKDPQRVRRSVWFRKHLQSKPVNKKKKTQKNFRMTHKVKFRKDAILSIKEKNGTSK